MKGVQLAGGLDLVSSKRSASPGSLQACKNFEVDGIKQGYTKSGGFVRYDGRAVWAPDSGGIFYQVTTTASAGPAKNWTPGQSLIIGPPQQNTLNGVAIYGVLCSWSTVSVGANFQYIMTIMVTSGIERPTSGATVTNFQLTEDVVIGSIADGIGGSNTSQFDANAMAFEAAYNALVTKVPGGKFTRIGGAAIFKNKVYVVADYRTILVSSGTYDNITPLEGDLIRKTDGTLPIGRIVQFQDLGGWDTDAGAGLIVIDTAGYADVTLTAGNALEVFRSSTAYALANYSQDLTSGGRAGLLTCGYQNDYEYSDLTDASDPAQNRWQRVNLGRQVRYHTGTNAPIQYARPGYVADLEPPSSVTEYADECSSTSAQWTNQGNGTGAEDANFVTEGSPQTVTAPLDFKFDLSAIPDGATITGIQVTIRRRANTANRAFDIQVGLLNLSGSSANYADLSTAWPTVTTDKVYGSSTDKWGNPLDVEQVKSDDFGVRLQVRRSATVDMLVDSCKIQVWYSPQTTTAYVYNGSTDVATVQVVHYTVEDGAFADNDASGVMVLDGLVTDAEKTTLLGSGMQLRSAASGGGNLLAVLASADTPITLPDSVSVQNAGFRYQLVEARPYAADNTQVLFICNGREACVMFDGTHAIPLRTGLDNEFEKPTHAAWWGSNLFLGYASGSIQVSATGDPVTFIGPGSDAQELAVGDFITGMIPLKGQALAVCTRRSIYAIYGRDAASFSLEGLAPDVGAVPYSSVNVGTPMLADQNGVNTLAAVQEYGNFARARLSDMVTPWLRGRMQGINRPDGFVAAIPVRYKSQYRMYFADGWIMTGTLRAEGGMDFTTQRYELDHDDRDVGCQVLALASGLFDDGTEAVFFSFANRFDSNRNRYLYRADCGRRYDGEHMHCFLATNFDHPQGATGLVKLDRVTVFADAVYTRGEVSFGTADNAINYAYPSSPYATVDFGWAVGRAGVKEVSFDTDLSTTIAPVARSVEAGFESFAVAFAITINDDAFLGGNAPVTFQELVYHYTGTQFTKR